MDTTTLKAYFNQWALKLRGKNFISFYPLPNLFVDELKANESAGAKHKSKAADKEATVDNDKVSSKDAKESKSKTVDGKK